LPLSSRNIAIKDNICTVDFPTTCASGILQDFSSPYDATVVQKLKDAGAAICGKTNMDEFGMGSHSTHSFFGSVVNRGLDGKSRSAGGSSGGSAVAVVNNDCWAALGTDTGGSVRLPAAFTGIFGFKPSYGLISRWGVVAYANSLDTVGILANSTSRVRTVFDFTNQYDGKDPTSLSPKSRDKITGLAEQAKDVLKGRRLRIGVPLDYNVSELSPTVRHAWVQLLHTLQQHYQITPVSLATTRQALSAYYVLAPAEASSNLAKYDGVRYGSRSEGVDGAGGILFSQTRGHHFGPEVKRRILLGSYSLSAAAIDNYFIQAQKIRRLVQRDFDNVFVSPNVLQDSKAIEPKNDGVDVLLCPTAPSLPPTIDELKDIDPLQEYVSDVFTVPASLAGLPAISLPFRFQVEDKPTTVGIQIIGQYGLDNMILDVTQHLEELGLTCQGGH
jgi:aspartyl-tRNA(Asn)/glutamyl-tRNA(Gln) amidotransferase subunit A